MKKNLKSVISFVIALALSAGSVSAFAAKSYSDVPADANYAEAVANLTAIGIVEGDGDGTFRPNDKITRAEVAAMVVRAMAQNSAAQSSAGPTSFTDVAADHWASGYINVASKGSGAFINGMGDGTFAPSSNVTYAQIVKMLVAAIGYGDWGVAAGGYPTGYISTAKQLGITDGVTGVNAEDQVSRAVVAQLVNNAIDTPLLALKTYSPTNPEYVVMDGTDDNDYETVLTYYHNIYKVEGRVTDTNKSNSSIDSDEIRYQIEVTKNYDDSDIVLKRTDKPESGVAMKVGDTDVADYLNVYSKLLVQIKDDEDPVVLSCVASGKNTTTTLQADAWDDEYYDDMDDALDHLLNADGVDKGQMWYYANSNKTGKSTRYYLADDFKMYVNGVEVDVTRGSVEQYVFKNKTGTVTLVDTPAEGSSSTDGKYDSIFVSYFATAIVDSVNSAGKVYFDNFTYDATEGKTSIEFDDDDEDLSYEIKLNGEKIQWSDLKKDDVLSISYSVVDGFEDSNFYDVLVSRDVAEGKVSEINEDDDEVGIDDKDYKLVDGMVELKDFTLGKTYSLMLDAFGRIVKTEKLASTVKYGIINRAYYSADNDEDRISVYDTTATSKTYKVADTFTYKKDSDKDFKEDFEALKDEYDEKKADEDNAYQRVVEYETNSKGEIKSVTVLDNGNLAEDKYTAKSSKIGSLKFDDATVMIAVDGTDFTKVSSSNLTDDAEYTAYGYDKDDSTYGFILITSGVGAIVKDTRFAVVEKVTQGTNDEGEDCDKIQLYTAGSKDIKTVYTDDKDVAYGIIEKGDVIAYTLNANGEIEDDKFTVIFKAGKKYVDYIDDKDEFAFDYYIEDLPDAWDKDDKDDDIQVYFGAVVDKSSGGIVLSVPTYDDDGERVLYLEENKYSKDANATKELDYDNDVAIYVYDYNKSDSNRLSVGATGSVAKLNVASQYKDDDKTKVYLDDLYDGERGKVKMPYALVKVNEDDVTDVFVIIPKD